MMEDQGSSIDLSMNRQRTINAGGRIVSLEDPIVMGILNLTPDSFYPGSRITSVEDSVQRTAQMLEEGAAIIDIGAASSRPGAEIVDVNTELNRLMPVLEALIAKFPEAIFSIDTCKTKVAEEALKAGAHIINDITAGVVEPEILEIVSRYRAPYIAMHMLGTPGNMPVKPEYRIAPPSLHKREGGRGGELEDVAGEVLRFLVERLRALREAGLTDIILDPGFGFGKKIGHNFQLLHRLEIFQFLELPVMVGLSRKSMIWRTLDITPDEALNGTTALHMIALQKGVNILRVHDVRAAREVIEVYKAYVQARF